MHKIIIVGAGLAGLIAARYATRSGLEVTIIDPTDPGGRARSPEVARSGEVANLGPHALYTRGTFSRVLDDLGVAYQATRLGEAFELRGGELSPMFTGPIDLFSRSGWALGVAPTIELVRAYAAILAGLNGSGQTFREWAMKWSEPVRERLFAAVRLSTYCHAAVDLDARIVGRQLSLAAAGVEYVDGGWGSLVAGLSDPIKGSLLRQKVVEVSPESAGVRVQTGDEELWADQVLIATPSAVANRLVPFEPVVSQRHTVAALDVIVDAEFAVERPLVLGVDEAVYFSDHGVVSGGRSLHALGYAGASRGRLEALIDRAAPGWREHTCGARYMRRITVCEALPGRRVPAVWHDRIACAGDWTDWAGDRFLSDAVAESAVAAADWLAGGLVASGAA